MTILSIFKAVAVFLIIFVSPVWGDEENPQQFQESSFLSDEPSAGEPKENASEAEQAKNPTPSEELVDITGETKNSKPVRINLKGGMGVSSLKGWYPVSGLLELEIPLPVHQLKGLIQVGGGSAFHFKDKDKDPYVSAHVGFKYGKLLTGAFTLGIFRSGYLNDRPIIAVSGGYEFKNFALIELNLGLSFPTYIILSVTVPLIKF